MITSAQLIRTTPLTDSFGVIVHELDLSKVDLDAIYPMLRDLFEEHSALLFPLQSLPNDVHLRLVEKFGPIEDRMPETRKPGEKLDVSPVSNETADGRVTDEMDMHTLHLKANQLWHIDSTFMPTPSLCNILTAKVVTTMGGQTELACTRSAWADMPEKLRMRIRGRILGHNYQRSRKLISEELAKKAMFIKWPPQRWPAVWSNPVNDKKALFIASHVYQVEGMDQKTGEALIDELIEFCTQPQFTYSHTWRVGDVLIWDQRAVMHRGRPWPYDQARTLASVCCSMTNADGLDWARAAVASQT